MADAAATLRYNTVAVILHWIIAILILTNIGLAWYFDDLPRAAQVAPTQLHKSIGIAVLLLTIARIAWRFVKPHPALPDTLHGWERWSAWTVYGLFYLFMIGMPLTGWAMVSSSHLIHVFPIKLFGVTWPAITPLTNLPQPQLDQAHTLFTELHEKLAWLAYALITLHVAAALRHQFLLKDDVLARMIPFLKLRRA